MTITTPQRREARTRASARPAYRPPLALRAFIGLCALGAAMFNLALMLSDRAPDIAKRIFGDFAVRMSARLNGSQRIGTLTEGRNPGSDAIVHIGVWAVAMVLIGLALWRWSALVIAAVMVFAAGIFIEIGQGRYTSSRAVELSDVAANGVGVVLGSVAAAACYLAWSTTASLVSRLGRT